MYTGVHVSPIADTVKSLNMGDEKHPSITTLCDWFDKNDWPTEVACLAPYSIVF